MTTDELIRQAFERQARQAPDPGQVLARFRVRAHRARRRRAMTRGAAAAVAAAVGVSAVLLGQDALTERPEPIPHQVQAGPPPAPVPLLYRPAWMPRGLTEVARWIGVGVRESERERVWASAAGGDSAPMVSVRVEGRTQGGHDDTFQSLRRLADAAEVTVKGHRALRRQDGAMCVVAWRPTAERVLSVTTRNLPGSCGDAVRTARSVVRDEEATVVPPLRAGWLPAPYSTGRVLVSRAGSGCRAELIAFSALRSFSIEVGRGSLPARGRSLQIGGRSARVYPLAPPSADAQPGTAIAVDLGAGRLLVVADSEGGPALTEPQLGRIAAGVSVGALDDACSWPDR
ncbi:hypothetical protein [Actinomadura sp. HBU206391]|uniref:hypothetical protein n=1 Tax=Actinomadura sp. HBU206391 TaxID=2731692 RepID=UPI00164F398F|nr:hypothetical protein [Actinomadura sp. HBU206391]MBC6456407.1 hypothetical protein [Actinomadura sp. HBU206391]